MYYELHRIGNETSCHLQEILIMSDLTPCNGERTTKKETGISTERIIENSKCS